MGIKANDHELFYVRVLHDTRTFGYLIPYVQGVSATHASLVERKRMLGTDWGLAVWKIDTGRLGLSKSEIYQMMEKKDKADADVLHIRGTEGLK